MAQGGRKPHGKAGPMPELAEFHDFLHTALGNSEFGSVHQLLSQVRTYISKQRLYEICGGRELAKRDEVERLARTLSVPPARFLAVWERARTAHEPKKLLTASARGAAVTPWRDDLPAPTGALLDLLRAQHEMGDAFPYRLLGVHAPPASKLLVKPALQPVVTQPHPEKEDPAARRPVPLEVPLGKHEHLLVVADPGYGKSMLGRSLVRQLCGRWLWTGEQAPTEEALVPLYIPATQIPATGAWSSRLAAAVGHNPYLVAEPGSALFADRVNEVRWLIVIDGLDEIHDPDRRHELLNALHQRILHSGPYRLVILSRPLPPGELELLRGPDLGEYTLQPFDSEQLAEFTRHWFEAQGAEQVDKEVVRFLDHVEESHLGEVVHIPLLATIAVAMQTTSPERPLPATQVELYERFVAELLNARPSTTGVKADWREWLHESRAALLSHLARLHLDCEAALLPAARRWVEQQQPENLSPPRDSERCVEQTLLDSGLITFTGGTLRFIHQSVVEYLAARHYADLAGTSFEPMQRWSAQVTKRATSSNLALFTLAIWSRNETNDGGLVIRRLLADSPGAIDVVVRLITVGARLDPDLKKAVVDGLIESFHKSRFDNKWVDMITRVRDLPTLAHRIEELVNSKTISFNDRVEAAAAFAWAIDRSRGVDMLRALIPSATPAGRLKVCNELFDLDHDRGSLTDLARSIISDPKASRTTRVNAAYTLASCGETEGFTELVTKVAESSENTDHEFVSAAEFLLEHVGRQHVCLIMDLLRAHRHTQPWRLGDLAEALQKVDAHAEVVELAREVIDDPDAEGNDELLGNIVRTWSLSAVRHGGALDIANAIRSASHISYMTRCSMAVELHKAGLSTEAANLLREFLSSATRADGRYWFRRAYETLLEIDNAAHLQHIVETASDWVLVGLLKLIDLLVKAGNTEVVVDAARRLLADPVTPREGRPEATKGWLHADRKAAATALSMVRRIQPAASERLQHAQHMGHYGAADEARALALDVLADPVAAKEHMLEAMKIVLRTGSRDETSAAIATLRANQRCNAQEKAWVATELSATDKDILSDLWLDVVVGSDVSLERRIRAAEELRDAGAQARGRAAIDAARLSSGLTNVEADRLNRLKGWLDTA